MTEAAIARIRRDLSGDAFCAAIRAAINFGDNNVEKREILRMFERTLLPKLNDVAGQNLPLSYYYKHGIQQNQRDVLEVEMKKLNVGKHYLTYCCASRKLAETYARMGGYERKFESPIRQIKSR